MVWDMEDRFIEIGPESSIWTKVLAVGVSGNKDGDIEQRVAGCATL